MKMTIGVGWCRVKTILLQYTRVRENSKITLHHPTPGRLYIDVKINSPTWGPNHDN